MKQIDIIPIWDNGQTQNAEILNAYVVNDNLSNSATFYYALLSASKTQLAQGNLSMTGEAYEAWQTNQYAYDWIAGQLNLTIIGDWVEPVIEPVLTTDSTVGMGLTDPSAKLEVTPVVEESAEGVTEK